MPPRPLCKRTSRPVVTSLVTVLTALFVAGDLPHDARADTGTCLAPDCHGSLLQKTRVHQAAGEDCSFCHLSASTSHPSGKGPDFSFPAAGGALCFPCHDQQSFAFAVPHGPAAAGACTFCHSPHAGDGPGMLKRPIRKLCLGCHTTMAEELQQGGVLHSAITEQECIACHQPHGGTRRYLLLKEGQELCFDCHWEIGEIRKTAGSGHQSLFEGKGCGNCHPTHVSNFADLLNKPAEELCIDCHNNTNPTTKKLRDIRAEVTGKKHLHAPLKESGCTACHNPHGGPMPLLLSRQYPAGVYAPFTSDTYSHCFQCHDSKTFTEPYTEELTGFRNGSRNLHVLHVNRGAKGRTCQMCHNAHASDVEHLINTDGMSFGKWRIPVAYVTKGNGGRCAPGCHREIEYDRISPLDYEQQATREE